MGPNAGPVAFIRQQGAVLRVRNTSTYPPFAMPLTEDKADPDVSAMVTHWGAREGGVTRAVHEVLNGRCIRRDGSRALVAVVGASFGYYALYAAMFGCR